MKNRRPLVIQPSALTDKAVSIVHERKQNVLDIAYVQPSPHGKERGFVVTINDQRCEDLFASSWLANTTATQEEFNLGVELHELCHVRYDTFGVEIPELQRFKLFAVIDNIFEDSRIEYHFSRDFPGLARYIRLVLSVVKRNIDTSGLQENKAGNIDRLNKMMHTLFTMVRFGVVESDADPDFASFVMGLMLSSTWGKRDNELQAAKAVFYYITKLFADDKALTLSLKQAAESTGAMGDEEIEGLLGMDQKAENTLLASVKDQLVQSQAGKGDTVLTVTDDERPLYRAVVNKYRDRILEIRSSWKRFFQGLYWKNTYDGELNLQRQQDAYINSISGDDGEDYQAFFEMKPELDLVFGRDCSTSTNSFVDFYAAVNIMLLASLEELDGIRTCSIDWSDNAELTKAFGEKAGIARIDARTVGGTQILPFLKKLEEQNFVARERMAFVITDGDWGDDVEGYKRMELMSRERHITWVVIHVDAENGEKLEEVALTSNGRTLPFTMWHCTLDTIASVVYRTVVRKMARSNMMH